MSDAVKQLRNSLRDPFNAVTSADSVGRHREVLLNVWNAAVDLAHGDAANALHLCKEALRSGRQPDETEDEYHAALNGIPSKAFGDTAPFTGVDKPQHFFATALTALSASAGTGLPSDGDVSGSGLTNPFRGELIGKAAGRAYEVGDWIKSATSNSGGYDKGDIFADDCGAKFGGRLAALTNAGERPLVNGSSADLLSHFGKNGTPFGQSADGDDLVSEQGRGHSVGSGAQNFTPIDSDRSDIEGNAGRSESSQASELAGEAQRQAAQARLQAEERDQAMQAQYRAEQEQREEQQHLAEERDTAQREQYELEQQQREQESTQQEARQRELEQQQQAEQRDAQERQQQEQAEQQQAEQQRAEQQQAEQEQREQEEGADQQRQEQEEQRQQEAREQEQQEQMREEQMREQQQRESEINRSIP